MRAIVQRTYGPPTDVLSVGDLPTPEPADGQVRIRVLASSINKGDAVAVLGRPWVVRPLFGLLRPNVPTPGRDVAGVIDAVGPGVTRWAAGDEVVGELNQGAWAEFACAPEAAVAAKPTGISFEAAAALPVSGGTALQGLRDHGTLAPGESLLINGASGNVGTFAVQVAKQLGATVTAVCSSGNVATASAIGADHVVDYRATDFTATTERYELIFDIAVSRPLSTMTGLLTPTGRYVLCGGALGRVARVALASMRNDSIVGPWVAVAKRDDLDVLTAWVEEGRIEPVIVRTIPLGAVPEAVRDQAEGHGRGKTVVRIGAPEGGDRGGPEAGDRDGP